MRWVLLLFPLLAAAFGGCAQPGPLAIDFAMIRVTDQITVTPEPGPKAVACGVPAGTFTKVDLDNKTVWVKDAAHPLRSLGPPFLILQTLTYHDTPETCPHIGWLYPLRRTTSSVVVDLHGHPYKLDVSRRADETYFGSREVGPGHHSEIPVGFQRTVGNTTYTYAGQIRFEFLGVWRLADVRADAPSNAPGISALWDYPATDREAAA